MPTPPSSPTSASTSSPAGAPDMHRTTRPPTTTCPPGHPPTLPNPTTPAISRATRLAVLLCLLACRPPPAQSLPICPALVAADRAAEADTRQLPADAWLGILVPGFDRTTHTAPEAPRDCSRA